MTTRTRIAPVIALGGAMLLALSACGGGSTAEPTGAATGSPAAGGDRAEVVLWTHNAGNENELKLVQEVTDAYNASQEKYTVTVNAFPQESYNDAVVSAAASGTLPCILDVDAPVVPSWAYAGYLAPLDIDPALTDPLLPGVKGMYDGSLYSVGFYDAALGMISRTSILEDNGIRIATADDPWTLDEFNDALATLKATGKYDYVMDWGTGWTGEWFPYAYSPLLQSFGGDLIDRADYATAEGYLNGDAGIAWGQWFQDQFAEGYANPKGSSDRTEFVNGKAAIQYNGSWGAGAAFEAFDDAVVLPPPNLGTQPVIGGGSWQWTGSATCTAPEAVNEWLSFALNDDSLSKFSETLGTLPASPGAAAKSTVFAEGAPAFPFLEFASKFVVIRPPTPAYPFIAKVYEKATADIMSGADVRRTLDAAVDEIDRHLADNSYFQ